VLAAAAVPALLLGLLIAVAANPPLSAAALSASGSPFTPSTSPQATTGSVPYDGAGAAALLAGPLNAGFETGDLTGWTVGGVAASVENLTASNFTPVITPTEGTRFALLSNGPGSIYPTAVGNIDGDNSNQCPGHPGSDCPEGDVSTLSQTFTPSAGEVPAILAFDWSFLTAESDGSTDPGRFDDIFQVTLNATKILTGSVPGGGISPYPDVAVDGIGYAVSSPGLTNGSDFSKGRSPLSTFSTFIGATGAYTVEFLVADQTGGTGDSGLLVDKVRLVPDPCDLSVTDVFTVTNTADSGAGSLRAAITAASGAGRQRIAFDIDPTTDPGCNPATGVCTIEPTSPLPAITGQVVLDGYTQPGAVPATATDDAILKIVVDGSLAGNGVDGFVVETTDSQICGLNIHSFRVTNAAADNFNHGNAIVIRGDSTLGPSTGNTIAGNFIGTNVTGDACVGNGGGGVLIGGLNSTAHANSNTVGGPNPEDRNIITCNGFQDQKATAGDGVTIRANRTALDGVLAADSNQVVGNRIGTDVTGTIVPFIGTDGSSVNHFGNTGNGVRIAGGQSNTVGGTTGVTPTGPCTGACNTISGNELAGVRIDAIVVDDANPPHTRAADNNVVEGHYIGTSVNGLRIRDAVFANNSQRNRVCVGDGAGGFACSDVSGDTNASSGVAVGDIDNDGNVDAVFANDSQVNRVCLGDGAGSFTTCSNVSPDTDNSRGVAIRDINGDLVADAVFANNGQENQVCLGNGAGGFACNNVSPDTNASQSVALGDLNGDGNVDAVFANDGQANRLCLGDGAGNFLTCSDVSTDTNTSQGVALGDLNGSNHLDAVFANDGQVNRVCLGDGAGGFTCSDISGDTNSSRGIALGDLDGNGDLDAVLANDGQTNRVCLGNGAGAFTCSDVSTDTNNSRGVALADLDGNGDLDAVLANDGQTNRVCLGDGAGGFTCSDVSASTNSSQSVALGDLKIDGDLGNTDAGVYIVGSLDDADGNRVGGTTAAQRNIISGNGGSGVAILGGQASSNAVQGNFVGTDITGAKEIPNDGDGVTITDAENNTVGGSASGAGNLVSGNEGNGIAVVNNPKRFHPDPDPGVFTGEGDARNNIIQGNYVGTDVSGTLPLGNRLNGVLIADAADNTIGGPTAAERNTISGNTQNGILLTQAGAPGNVDTDVVTAEGTDGGGADFSLSDSATVNIGVASTLVVTKTASPITVAMAGDSSTFTVEVENTSGGDVTIKSLWDSIHGNLNGQGSCAVPQTIAAGNVYTCSFSGAVIGGGGSAETNVVTASGTDAGGSRVTTSDGSTVNIGGTDGLTVTKTADVTWVAASGTTVDFTVTVENDTGGTVTVNRLWDTKHGSLIPGLCGVLSVVIPDGGSFTCNFSAPVSGAAGNIVAGNYIGTDLNGTAAVPNGGSGIYVNNASDNSVGGGTAAQGNTISGNRGRGMSVLGPGAAGNLVRHNLIGTQVDGTSALGNRSHGIAFDAGASDNAIGVASTTPQDNTIAHNLGDGVLVHSATGNSVLSNSIFENNELGIDLGTDNAVTPNDAGDPDAGANNLQNFPELTSASTVAGPNTEVVGSLNSTPSTQFTIQFFASAACDPSGFGEGRTFLAEVTLATDGAGNLNFSVLLGTGGLSGQFITATATDPNGNTSEFSNCVEVDAPPQEPALTIDKAVQDLNGGDVEPGDTLHYTINYENTGNADATGVFITDDYSGFCATINNVTVDANFTTFSDAAGVLRWPENPNTTTLPAGASGTLSYDCTLQTAFPSGTSDVDNTATIDSAETTPQDATQTVQVTATHALTINKTVLDLTGGSILPGDRLYYTITYANTGNADATGVFITDDYSNFCATISNVTVDAHFPTYSDAAGVLRWPATPNTTILPAGASGSVNYLCRLQAVFPAGTSDVQNSATIDSAETTPQNASQTVQVTAAPLLTINKACTPTTGDSPGDTVTCTITFANTGNADATGVSLVDDYDQTAVASIGNFQEAGGAIFGTTPDDDGDRLRWPDAVTTVTLPAGASGSVSYDVNLQGPGSFPTGTTDVNNTATIDSAETTPQDATETIQVTAGPRLTIDKACSPVTGNSPADTINCSISYANTGDADATSVTIVDDYDQTYGSVSGITGSAHFAAGTDDADTMTWGPATIPAGQSGTVSYDYVLAGAGSFPVGTTNIQNTATIDSTETTPRSDGVTVQVTVAAPPPTFCFDFDGDGIVDLDDLNAVKSRWDLTAANPDPDGNPATPNYSICFDTNGDGGITVADILSVGSHLGLTQTCSCTP
jgi:hypothetical protein